MTSIEVPYSIAAALPTLSVMDITNEVAQSVARSERAATASRTSPRPTACRSFACRSVRRASSRISKCLLERVVPGDAPSRERLVYALLGSRTEQVPFSEGRLCLGQWQRVMLFSLEDEHRTDWSLTLLG